MDTCQKCNATIAPGHGRWMFTPPGAPPSLHLDKCQSCGEWTALEQALVTEKLRQYLSQANQKVGGCNCTGTR